MHIKQGNIESCSTIFIYMRKDSADFWHSEMTLKIRNVSYLIPNRTKYLERFYNAYSPLNSTLLSKLFKWSHSFADIQLIKWFLFSIKHWFDQNCFMSMFTMNFPAIFNALGSTSIAWNHPFENKTTRAYAHFYIGCTVEWFLFG